MLVMLPLSASAQVLSPEVEARIQVLWALVLQLQEQLAELKEAEREKKQAKQDQEERCEEAHEEWNDATEALEAYEAETKEMKKKMTSAPGQTLAQGSRAVLNISRARSAGYIELRDEETRTAEAVADNCD